jgi:hypothetical protein
MMPGEKSDASAGFKEQECFAHWPHIVHSEDLHALASQGQRPANCPGGAVGVLVAKHLADESLARVSHQQWKSQLVKLPAIHHER